MSIFIAIIALYVVRVLVSAFNMRLMNALMETVLDVGVLALIVIFQPELRRALEHLGRSKITTVFSQVDKDEAKLMIGEFVRAIENMSASRTGALIVSEIETWLNDIVETGTTMKENGLHPIEDIHPISARLIVNIASMKLYKEEIFDFLKKLEDNLED